MPIEQKSQLHKLNYCLQFSETQLHEFRVWLASRSGGKKRVKDAKCTMNQVAAILVAVDPNAEERLGGCMERVETRFIAQSESQIKIRQLQGLCLPETGGRSDIGNGRGHRATTTTQPIRGRSHAGGCSPEHTRCKSTG